MKQNGFTLIELMVTIVIVAILAGIAVPQYLAYTRRAEVTEMVALADIVKKKASIFYSTTGGWPIGAEGAAESGLDLMDMSGETGTCCIGANSENTVGVALMSASGRWSDTVRVLNKDTSEKYIIYKPDTSSQAALTWTCKWKDAAERDYPGAKPDGCK